MIGVGVGVGRELGSLSMPYHPSQEDGYLAWFDGETLARNNTPGNVIASWQSHEGTYTATQAVNANRPVAQADANGVLYVAGDGIDDYLTLNTPAIGTQGYWIFWLGRVTGLGFGFDAILVFLGSRFSYGAGLNFTAESTGRFNSGRSYADAPVSVGTALQTASIRAPANGLVQDNQISLNGVDRAMYYDNGANQIILATGGSLVGIPDIGSLNGATYAVGIYTGAPDAAARTRVRDYARTRAKLI